MVRPAGAVRPACGAAPGRAGDRRESVFAAHPGDRTGAAGPQPPGIPPGGPAFISGGPGLSPGAGGLGGVERRRL
ncbi:hypothetical protein B5F19_08210 [Pseudoflavonifractor sp. An184]|nr:hypothetical protein B5F19_08210 [Pseudoflavonifractor sp. An184]